MQFKCAEADRWLLPDLQLRSARRATAAMEDGRDKETALDRVKAWVWDALSGRLRCSLLNLQSSRKVSQALA